MKYKIWSWSFVVWTGSATADFGTFCWPFLKLTANSRKSCWNSLKGLLKRVGDGPQELEKSIIYKFTLFRILMHSISYVRNTFVHHVFCIRAKYGKFLCWHNLEKNAWNRQQLQYSNIAILFVMFLLFNILN